MNNSLRVLLTMLALTLCLPAISGDSPPVFSVDDTEALHQRMGEETVVEGKVHASFWVRGVLLITFREEQEGFVAAAFARNRRALDAAFGDDIAKSLSGKNIRIRGTLSEHRYRPQIVVETPDQITILDE